MIRICLAGATGWTGRAIAPAILAADDLDLVGAIARRAAGQDLGVALGGLPLGVVVEREPERALEGADVLVDYSSHESAKVHARAAIERGVAVVIGASGLSAADLEELGRAAEARGVGVVAAGNFSLTAAMAQAGALLAARHLSQWEIIDYASATKADVPSGTARELAERLSAVRPPALGRSLDDLHGPREARGATVSDVQVHSVRLPSFVVSTEVVFGLPDERLTIRHEAGASPQPYVAGTLLAVRRVRGLRGLTRGLDTLLLEP